METFPHEFAVAVDVLHPLGLVFHDLQGSKHRGGIRRRYAGAEDETARVMFDVIDHRE